MQKNYIITDDLTFENAETRLRELSKLIKNADSKKIGFNLENLGRCDSAGVALLIELKRIGQRLKKEVYFENYPQSLRGLLKFCNVESIF